MAEYEGMRWFKCDFQVQTPEDGTHWADANTRLPDPRRPTAYPEADENGSGLPRQPDESRLQDVARVYLRRCHELGLQLIGVTDHNFSQKTEQRDWFLTHLVEQNKSVAVQLGKEPLYILPGFEVDIGYHVLCLFAPATTAKHVWRTNRLLSNLGLNEDQRFRGGRPNPLRRAGANVSLKELIEFVQDEHMGIVIAAHSDQTDGILTEPRHIDDYKNKKLMALEVTSNPPARRFVDIFEGKNREWSRSDCHPAYVMSSDAKSLKNGDDGMPCANSLGYRHTWLKMSKPSIESLRQAFLDPLSRIRLMGDCPHDEFEHPRITKVAVTGAKFLEDQHVYFSGGLNCVIGGRGSGKSTLLEYLRFAIGLDGPALKNEDTSLQRKRDQLRSSLATGAEVRVSFAIADGVTDTLVYNPSRVDSEQRRLEGRQVVDLKTVLRQLQLQFFSQGELSRMTSGVQGQAQVLSLIDTACGVPLMDLNAEERDIRARLKTLFQAKRDETRLQGELFEAQQEAFELGRQLKAREAVQGDSQRNQLALQARMHLKQLKEFDGPLLEAIDGVKDYLIMPLGTLPDHAHLWPNAQWFVETEQRMRVARDVLGAAVTSAVEVYLRTIEECVGEVATHSTADAIEADEAKFHAACAERGIPEDDIARLQDLEEKRQSKLKLVDERNKRLVAVKLKADQLPTTLAELHSVWRSQFEVRTTTADAIQAAVASETIRVRTSFMADEDSFKAGWARLAPIDKRGKLAKRWEDIGDYVFNSWLLVGREKSPWECVESARLDDKTMPLFTQPGFDDLHSLLCKHLESAEVQFQWEDVRTTRVSDGIDVELLREDRTVAGSMRGALSEGQRNTVLLNLMLARGDGPIVIDQPEDELDSNFIYKTLVRDLRAAKSKRQLIVATHNANLPVNADAEQIYAIEARDGRGKLRATGGLDRKDVAEAVLDIMEGSEQAFKRRSEKYHF